MSHVDRMMREYAAAEVEKDSKEGLKREGREDEGQGQEVERRQGCCSSEIESAKDIKKPRKTP